MIRYQILRGALALFAWACFIGAGAAVALGFMGTFDTVFYDPILRTSRAVSRLWMGFVYAAGLFGSAVIFSALASIMTMAGGQKFFPVEDLTPPRPAPHPLADASTLPPGQHGPLL